MTYPLYYLQSKYKIHNAFKSLTQYICSLHKFKLEWRATWKLLNYIYFIYLFTKRHNFWLIAWIYLNAERYFIPLFFLSNKIINDGQLFPRITTGF